MQQLRKHLCLGLHESACARRAATILHHMNQNHIFRFRCKNGDVELKTWLSINTELSPHTFAIILFSLTVHFQFRTQKQGF